MKILIPFFAPIFLSIGSMVLPAEVYDFSSKATLITVLFLAIWILLKRIERIEQSEKRFIEKQDIFLNYFQEIVKKESEFKNEEIKELQRKIYDNEEKHFQFIQGLLKQSLN